MTWGLGCARWRWICGIGLAFLAFWPTATRAATLVVNTTSDNDTPGNGLCSLRKAIASVDAPGSPSPDCATPSATDNTIMLGVTGASGSTVYRLTIQPSGIDDDSTGDLNIAGTVTNLTIEGAGAASTTIDASGLGDRALNIAAGASVSISGLTISGGHAPSGAPDGNADGATGAAGASGGGIFNRGTLTLTDVVVTGNTAGSGGQAGATLGSTSGGIGGAGGAGGGIDNTGTLMLADSTVTGNSAGAGGTGGATARDDMGQGGAAGVGGAGGPGGGIENGGTLTLTDSTVSGNTAGAGGGGGDEVEGDGAAGSGGTGGAGGGVDNASGTLTLTDSTIDGNTAGTGGAGGGGVDDEMSAGGGGGTGGAGGGVQNGTGTLELTGTTIDGNKAGAGGGGAEGASPEVGDGLSGGAGGCGGTGGGVDTISAAATTISASTISANNAGGGGTGGTGGAGSSGGTGGAGCAGSSGGGIFSTAPLIVTDSTLTANFAGAGGTAGGGGPTTFGTGGAGGGGGTGGSGGAVRIRDPNDSSLLADTVFGNGVGAAGSGGAGGSGGSSGVTGQNGASGTAGDAGGIESDNTLCVVGFNQCGTILQDTIVASDSGGNCAGLFSDGGNNLSFGDTTCFGINGDPKLGPLQDNGGPTETSDLGPGSAAINAGPASGPGCPATDQRGLPRPFGDACDIGAYEVTPPVATTGGATGVGSSTATLAGTVTANDVSASIRFDLGTTKTYGVQSTVQQVAGLTPAGVSTTFTGLTPSTTYHYRITATSSDGTTDGGDATFTTTAAHVGTTGPPIVGAITLRPSAFAAARSGASVTRAARTGTTVSYTDSETARTTLTILRARAGVLKGRKCTKPPPHPRSRRLRRCTRYVPVGSFIHADLAGTNRFHFTGRIGDHALVVGRYRLTAVPRANGTRGATVNATFRIIG